MNLSSALYAGTIRHRRFTPVSHEFRHGCYQLLLDIDELDTIDARIPIFAHNRASLTSFYDRDHLGDRDLPLRTKLTRWLDRQGVSLGDDRVFLLTNLRVLGYVFNPVSYFYCLDDRGDLRFVVAETRNTWGESYCYLLADFDTVGRRGLKARTRKVFHVSPFVSLDRVEYDWIVTPPSGRLTVHVDEFEHGDKFLDATLTLRRYPLNTRRLLWALARYPHMTARTIFLIHWQAFQLWRKGAPVFTKPEHAPANGLEEL